MKKSLRKIIAPAPPPDSFAGDVSGFAIRHRGGKRPNIIGAIKHAEALPPVEVPRCLNLRQYLNIVQDSQGD